MIAVLNYGAGNLPNVVRALQHVGADLLVTQQPDELLQADAVVFPGVGATRDTMQALERLQLGPAIHAAIGAGKPFLGICVGMQVLCTLSEEFGAHACLGVLDGTVRRLPAGLKVPQIGWNALQYAAGRQQHALLRGIPDGSQFYFVHSYYCDLADPSLWLAGTEYGLAFPSILARENLMATQFHPEKSGRWGLQLLQNFVAIAHGTDSRH